MADDVRLTDLEVIQRYSIAVRGETADRDDLLEALKADVAWLERSGRAPGKSARKSTTRTTRTPARKTATKSTRGR